jgi:hypothetical protein
MAVRCCIRSSVCRTHRRKTLRSKPSASVHARSAGGYAQLRMGRRAGRTARAPATRIAPPPPSPWPSRPPEPRPSPSQVPDAALTPPPDPVQRLHFRVGIGANGVSRPGVAMPRRAGSNSRQCRNCKVWCAPAPWWEGRCATCHTYWRRYGTERPRDARRDVGSRSVPCGTCRHPTRARDLRYGQCPRCIAAAQQAPRRR